MRVLVVDDSRVSARVVQGMLESLGCTVRVAANGGEAVTVCVEGGFDMVFMDVRMPVLDGCAAAREIRRREAGRRRTPIVALTAEEVADERTRCLEAGMDGALVKPVTASDLATALERWTGQAFSASSARATAGSEPKAPSAHGPVDHSVLDELRTYLGPRGVAERVDDYLHHLEARLRGLREAWEREDAARVQHVVHGLKGTSGFVGAHGLARLCREVEEDTRNANAVPARLIEALEREGEKVRRDLEAWRHVTSGGTA